jgi:hypothetical protein
MPVLTPSPDIRIPGGDLPLKVLPNDGQCQALPLRFTMVSPAVLDFQWVFPLDESILQMVDGVASPIVQAIKAVFPVGFVPNRKAKYVRFRFENEDGSFWGGEDIDITARFSEFFEWKWTNPKNGLSQPHRWHRPVWLTFRAWQIVRSQVSMRAWDPVPTSELTIEILQARKDYFDKGMYQEHGFPVRLILTLE